MGAARRGIELKRTQATLTNRRRRVTQQLLEHVDEDSLLEQINQIQEEEETIRSTRR